MVCYKSMQKQRLSKSPKPGQSQGDILSALEGWKTHARGSHIPVVKESCSPLLL